MDFNIKQNFIKNNDVFYTKFYNKKNYKFIEISNNILNLIDEFILVIDFPDQTGGATFFLDLII
jgi:hypothetical protein